MNRTVSIKLIIICFLSIIVYQGVPRGYVWGVTFSFVVELNNDTERIDLTSADIDKIGINSRLTETRVEMFITSDYHKLLESLTKKNIGRKMNITVNDELLFSGTIYEPIRKGTLSFSCASVDDAKIIIEKLGCHPEYHFEPITGETEGSQHYKSTNPWLEKALDAHFRRDLARAEEYAKRAIEEEPNMPTHYQLLSAIYYDEGKIQMALENLLEGEKKLDKNVIFRTPGIYLSIAELYSEVAQYEKAILYFKKVLSANPNNVLARIGLAKNYEKIGKHDLALERYYELLMEQDEYLNEQILEDIEHLKNKIEVN